MNTPNSLFSWAIAYHRETQALIDKAKMTAGSFSPFDIPEGSKYREDAQAFFAELGALHSEIDSRQDNLDRFFRLCKEVL